MGLKKLSITEQEAEIVRQLVAKGLSAYKISDITGITRIKVWRNIEFMGLNKKSEVNKKPCKFFRWNDFKNKSVI